MKAGIALGSILGDRLANLRRARDQLLLVAGEGRTMKQSAIYETVPVNCKADAGSFYNAVIEIDFAQAAGKLLHRLQKIEETLCRLRIHPRNVSRTIDLDLLYCGDAQQSDPELQLPHPRLREREFVLRPLADVAPELRLPGETASVRELLARFPASDAVKCLTRDW